MERAVQHGQEGIQPTKKAQRKTGGGPARGEPSDTSKLIVEVLSPVSTTVTITLHEGTPTCGKKISILSHVTK